MVKAAMAGAAIALEGELHVLLARISGAPLGSGAPGEAW